MTNIVNHTTLFKQALGNYPTGVSIVTAVDESNDPIGLTVNSLASVSIDPLLLLWSIDENVSTYHTFKDIDKFAVNILAGDQKDIAYLFASKELDRFSNCEWEWTEHGLPIIKGAMSSIECKTYEKVEIGDHTTLFGEVIDITTTTDLPLLYHRRKIEPFPDSFHEES